MPDANRSAGGRAVPRGFFRRLIEKLPGFGSLPEEYAAQTPGDSKPVQGQPGGHGPGRGPMGAFAGGRARDSRQTLRRLAGYFSDHKGTIIMALIAVLVTTSLSSVGPMLMGRAVNLASGAVGSALGLPGQFFLILLAYAAIVLIMSIFQGVSSWLMAGVSQRVVHVIRGKLFGQIQKLSLRFFDSREKGDLMSRLTNDVETVSSAITNNVGEFVGGFVSLTVTLIFMVVLNWRLAILALVPVPLSMMMTRYVASVSRKYFYRQSKALGAVNGFMEEIVSAQQVVKVFCREREEEARFARRNEAHMQLAIRAQVLTGIMMPTINLINNIGFALLAAVGGWFVVRGWADVGMLLTFFMYARNFGRPIAQMGQVFAQIQSALAGAERVFEIMDEVPEIQDEPGAVDHKISGQVKFEHVNFGYLPGVPVLKDINLTAQPGQVIALVGPTGAGKTTIVNLLTRFYDIESGKIEIDGMDIRRFRKDCLRSQLGIVLQDTYLFAESVMDNIRYGRLTGTDEEVRTAAIRARADQFIHRLPDGYATALTEEGSNLSQGQRQLLAISRAMMADPAILILDEATSSVDTRTEVHIQQAMLELMRGRTCFVIAHRLSTIQKADKILVIDEGRIVERGTHSELLERKGFYHRLYQSQFAGQDREARA
jgi:ATP-binding cassette subfamily B protein